MKYPYTTRTHNREAGFTLAETLIAIAILVITVAGPLTLAQQSLKTIRFTEDEVTAQYLAQDLMDYLRGYRDTQLNLETVFLGSLTNDCASGYRVCTFDTTKTGAPTANMGQYNTQEQAESLAPLRFDPTTGRYGYEASWQQTPYTRTAYFLPPSGGMAAPGDYATVVVTVTWEDRNLSREYQISQTMYNLP